MSALLKDRTALAVAALAPLLDYLHELPPDALLSRREAAIYLGVAEGTLAQWASTGRQSMPFTRVGSLTKYRRADLDSFLANHRIAGTA